MNCGYVHDFQLSTIRVSIRDHLKTYVHIWVKNQEFIQFSATKFESSWRFSCIIRKIPTYFIEIIVKIFILLEQQNPPLVDLISRTIILLVEVSVDYSADSEGYLRVSVLVNNQRCQNPHFVGRTHPYLVLRGSWLNAWSAHSNYADRTWSCAHYLETGVFKTGYRVLSCVLFYRKRHIG